MVRFFDGAGNEIDAASKTQVIFVASDASRFLEALRQLAESESASQDMLKIALGPQIKEARRLSARAAASDTEDVIAQDKLKAIQNELPPATDNFSVQSKILRAATAVSGSPIKLDTAVKIRDFLRAGGEQ